MATNGILDITTEDYMGQDPEMQIDQDEMIEIIRTLQVIGIPQDKHPEVLEAFKEWKQTNAGTVDMFLEASLQLEPGTITKIKEQKQMAQGPQDMPSEDDMNIPPGSDDMLEIMQSVGAPQRAAQGGRIGYQAGEQVLPMPRPTEEDPRAGFFERMGAMPEQTLLQRAGPTRTSTGIMNQAAQAMGPYGGQEGDIGMGGQPLGEYEHEGAEQPQSWWDRMRTGTTGTPLENEVSPMGQGIEITIEMVMDFLRKMKMSFTKENIKKVWEALAAAKKFGGEGEEGLGLAGLTSLGAPQRAGRGGSIGKAEGGIIDAVPRQGFFLGKVAKALTGGAKKLLKSAKKVLKSDLGKMAMMYIATAGFSNVAAQQGLGGAQKWGGFKWLQPGNVGRNISSAVSRVIPWGKDEPLKKAVTSGRWFNPAGGVGAAGQGGQFMEPLITGGKQIVEGAQPWYKGALPWIAGASLAGGAYTAANPGDVQFDTDKRDAEVDKWTQWLAGIPPADDIVYPYPDYVGAQGGRVGVRDGGIMDLGGGEKDYRNTGGFVDIGAKEKADDVPARLSVNEFVMTADAVRGAGDGDVEEGAERLQDTMKQLEQKGKRHKAAQGMFATSQRLGEVI